MVGAVSFFSNIYICFICRGYSVPISPQIEWADLWELAAGVSNVGD